MLFKINSSLCSFCKMVNETPLCLLKLHKNEFFRDQLKEFITNTILSIPSLTPQSAILGHIDLSDYYLLIF